MPYLLDADWVINALGGHRDAAPTLRRLNPQGISISLVTMAELFEGAFRSPNPGAYVETYRGFLLPYRKLGITESIAERFAEVRAFLRRRGELSPDFDILLGATALEHDLTLLTFDTQHFRRIPDLRLYSAS